MTRSLPAPPRPPGPLLAGVDVGSTHCKALLCTADGTVVARAQVPTDTTDLATTALDALTQCVRSAGGTAPEAVGITGMAESGVPLDREGRPVGPMLMWSDPAPAPHADRLARAYGPAELHARTGVLPSAKVPLARWHWLRAEHPERLARMHTWAGAADLVAHALTGRTGTDTTFAQRTMAWDPDAGGWHPELLADAGLTPDRMPHVHGPGDPAGRVTARAAARTGLRPGTPVVVAGHDHLVGAWTAGARTPGCVADSMGTAEAVVTVSATPPDRAAAAREGMSWGRHADGSHFVTVAGMSSSGALVEWFCDRFLPHLADVSREERYAAFARLVGGDATPTGLTVEPYLYGRSAPRPDPGARLAVHGIGVHHGVPELARALLEGAAHQARWMADVQSRLTRHPTGTVTLLGGSTRLRAWTALKAAVTPWRTEVCDEPEAPCLGAAAWASAALGNDPASIRPPHREERPPPRAAEAHRHAYETNFLPRVTGTHPGTRPSTAPDAPAVSGTHPVPGTSATTGWATVSGPVTVSGPSATTGPSAACGTTVASGGRSGSDTPAATDADVGTASDMPAAHGPPPDAGTDTAPSASTAPGGATSSGGASATPGTTPPVTARPTTPGRPMSTTPPAPLPTTLTGGSLAPGELARPSGTFAMVAMDQRDSLRTMMAERAHVPGTDIPDDRLTTFKLAVARTLGPHASALLIDRDYGYRPMLDTAALPPGCAPILAVDALGQEPGGPVQDTTLDTTVDPAAAAAEGTRGLKLLVIWRRDGHEERRIALAAHFIDLCRSAGLASVLEPVARPTAEQEAAGTFRLNDAIVDAAHALAPLRPSLYKCQVPDGGRGSVARIAAQAERIDAVVDVPWVVLSQGVALADFPDAVEAACRAGASGFLAGRALWTDALDNPDPEGTLAGPCTDRLERLAETVDTHGRPWWTAGAAAQGASA